MLYQWDIDVNTSDVAPTLSEEDITDDSLQGSAQIETSITWGKGEQSSGSVCMSNSSRAGGGGMPPDQGTGAGQIQSINMPPWNNMPPPLYDQTSDEDQPVCEEMMVLEFDGSSDTDTDTNWEDGSDSDMASEASKYEPSSYTSSFRDNSNSDSKESSCGYRYARSSASSVLVPLILAMQNEQNQPVKNTSNASTMTQLTADVLSEMSVYENVATTTMEIDCAREWTISTSMENEWAQEVQIRSEDEKEREAEDNYMLEDIIEDECKDESTSIEPEMEVDMPQGNMSNPETCNMNQMYVTASDKINTLVPIALVSENTVSQHTTEQTDSLLYEIPQELPHMEIVRETPLPSLHDNNMSSIMPMPLAGVQMPCEAYCEPSMSPPGRDYHEGCRFSCQIEGGMDIAIPSQAAMPWHPREFLQIPELTLPPTILQVGVQMRILPTN
ncbi:hypothetical protein H4S08_004058 [Coemansia sp. RSA 1365]|nr:hypothetical protein H4S08_004058 [Coemansia sp. RSA 1365]